MKSYTIRIPGDAAEIPALFGHESVRRSILAIPTISVTTTMIHAPVRPDNGDRDAHRIPRPDVNLGKRNSNSIGALCSAPVRYSAAQAGLDGLNVSGFWSS